MATIEKVRITTITEGQASRLPLIAAEWKAVGLSTEPADRPRAEAGIRLMYERAGLPAPRRIVWCGSPLSMVLTHATLRNLPADHALFRAVEGASVRASVRASVGDSVRDSVWDSVWDSVINEYLVPGLAFYAAFSEVFDLKEETQRLNGLWEFSRSAGWLIPCREIAFVSERHNVLSLDERGMLHADAGPAVEYPDGWRIFAVHGVRVPAWLIERPDQLVMEKIDQETNAEVQRVMIERFGWEWFLEESKADIIDHDEVRGTLYRTRRNRSVDPILMLVVTNRTAEPDGSFRKYVLPVHHELRPLPDLEEDPNGRLGEPQRLTAHNAVASTFGLRGHEYAPEMES